MNAPFQLFDALPAHIEDALRASIERFGVLVPVVKDQHGNVLDGHHRARIADQLGVPYRVDVVQVADEDEAREIARTLNADRRQLTEEQRRAVAVELRKQGYSYPAIAGALGVSTMTAYRDVRRAEKEGTLSPDKVPGLSKGIDGNLRPARRPTVVAAKDEREAERAQQALALIGDDTPAAPVLEVRDVERAARQKEREERTAALTQRAREIDDDSPVQVRQMDCMDLIASLDDGSVSLLLTDPPYNVTDHEWDTWPSDEEYWRFTREWLGALRPKMADEFTAFVFCDADASPQMYQALVDTGWPVLRQAIWHRPNLAKKRSGSMTFLSSYEPFWHAGTRGLFLPDEWGEERFDVQRFVVPQSTHTTDPSYHPTQKPLGLFRRLVSIGSLPGELVVDPFVGAGTTAVACQMEGRRCLAGDQSAEYVQITLGRLAQAREAA